MLKKTLLSLAVASSVSLTGCLDDGSTTENASVDYQITNPDFTGKTYPVFNPLTGELPIPNDLIWDSEAADGTFIVSDTAPPVTTALNNLSGASLTAPIDIPMNGAVDPTTVDGRAFLVSTDSSGNPTVIPNPSQTVFLIELDYASGEPITALTSAEPPTIPTAVTALKASAGDTEAGAALFDLAQNPQYEASVVDLNDGTSVIRINPLKPLNPRKRYVVAITNEVKDINGESIVASPAYQNLTLVLNEGTENEQFGPVGNSAFVAIQQLMNKLWEPIAESYFGLPNQVRASLGLPSLSKENLAISYSFTTTNDTKVMPYMTEPNKWFEATLKTAISTGARTAAMAAGASTYDEIKAVVDGAMATWPDEATQAALGDAYTFCASQGAASGEAAISCLSSVFSSTFEDMGLIDTRPKAHDITFYSTTDAANVSALMSVIGVQPGEVSVAMGSMEIPYYLGVPTETDGSPITNSYFKANQALAQALNAQFGAIGLSLPQADPSVSQVVNYLFPFPQKTADVKIPVLAMYPTSAQMDTGNLPVVMYQHGITTDRSAALTYGSLLAKTAGVVVIAIDQPLHGVDAISTTDQKALATSLLEGAGIEATDDTVDAVVAGTFHVGVLLQIQEQGCPTNITDPTDADQIAAAQQLVLAGTCGADAATSLGGALVLENTVANGASTIPGLPRTDFERHFNFTADASLQPIPMVFDHDTAVGSSGSLFNNLLNFMNSRDNLRQMESDLQHVRLSIAGIDLNNNGVPDVSGSNVYFIGHSLGTVDGIPFVAMVNNNGTPDDDIVAANFLTPGGGVVRLLENSPSFSGQILGGLEAAAGLKQGDLDLETYFNVLQATVDSGDSVNFAADLKSTKSLFSIVIGDQTIPNWPYPEENALGNATPAALSGSEPIAMLAGATSVHGSTTFDGPAVTRYTGGTHGTPVLPPPGDETAAAVFAEMVGQSASMILTGGTQIMVTNTDVVQQADE